MKNFIETKRASKRLIATGLRYSVLGLITLLFSVQAFAQQLEEPLDTTDRIIVDYSELAEFIVDKNGERQILTGSVELHQDSTFMYCNRAELKEDNRLTAIGEVLIQQTDSVFLFSDSLMYFGNEQKAELYGGVSLVNGKTKLFSEELFYDLDKREAYYEKSAILTDGRAKMISKKGTYFVNENLAVFVDSVIIIDSNFILKTDSLQFNTEENKCYFVGPTVILQDQARIYCESGYYDLNSGIALFSKNAEYRNKDQYSRGDSMIYHSQGSKVELLGNAEYRDSTRTARAQSIQFWQDSEEAILSGDAFLEDNGKLMQSDSIYYDGSNEAFYSEGRSRVWNAEQYIEADELSFPPDNQWGYARGDVIMRDSIQNTILRAERVNYNQTSNEILAVVIDTVRPYLINIVRNDSMWISADSFFVYHAQDSIQLDSITTIDTSRIILAYHHVKIFKSDLQLVCDSMAYSEKDSIFHFYDEPVMWSDTSQFIADTISAIMKNESIDRIIMNGNALILNSTDEIMFNQMQGRHIVAEFDSTELRRMYINGNAKSVYYALDDEGAYIGVNQSICSKMLVLFGSNEVEGLKFYTSPESLMSPMNKVDHEAIKLDGFYWETNRRPKSKWEVIRWDERYRQIPSF